MRVPWNKGKSPQEMRELVAERVDAVVESVRHVPRNAVDIAECLGFPPKVVNHYIRRAVNQGRIDYEIEPDGRGQKPRKLYHYVHEQERT